MPGVINTVTAPPGAPVHTRGVERGGVWVRESGATGADARASVHTPTARAHATMRAHLRRRNTINSVDTTRLHRE